MTVLTNMKKSLMMKISSIVATISVSASVLFISDVNAEVLRSGFPLMMEITDSRMLALGGAALTESGRVDAMSQNVASLSNSSRNLSASYAKHPSEIWSGRLLAGDKIGELNYAAYLQTYGYGSFNRSESGFGSSGGTFDASENLFGVGVAGELFERFAWGIGGKIDWLNLDGTTSAAGAIDIGITYDPEWEKMKFGISLKNWGSEFGGDEKFETPTPTELSFAASKRLQHLPLTLYSVVHLRRNGEGDVNANFLPNEPGIAYGAGGEFEITPSNAEKPFHLRFGYRSIGQGFRVGNSKDTFAGFSFGLGLFVKRLSFDYAFAPFGALGHVHRLGISKTLNH